MKNSDGVKRQTRGIIDAIISSSTFGFSPFFSVSLLALGLGALDILSYRWGVASLFLILIASVRKIPLRITWKEFSRIFILSH